METEAASQSNGVHWSYAMLCLALGAVTALEWACYLRREQIGLPAGLLAPLLIALSAGKFAAVVAYYARPRPADAGWPKKAFAVALVFGGGTSLLFPLLTN